MQKWFCISGEDVLRVKKWYAKTAYNVSGELSSIPGGPKKWFSGGRKKVEKTRKSVEKGEKLSKSEDCL